MAAEEQAHARIEDDALVADTCLCQRRDPLFDLSLCAKDVGRVREEIREHPVRRRGRFRQRVPRRLRSGAAL